MKFPPRKVNSLTLRYGRDIDILRQMNATLRNYTGLTAYWLDPELPGMLNNTDSLKVSWDKRFGRGAPIATIRGAQIGVLPIFAGTIEAPGSSLARMGTCISGISSTTV